MTGAGMIVLPQGRPPSQLSNVTITPSELETLLEAFEVDTVSQAIPDSILNDSVAVCRTGEIVHFADLHNVYTLTVPDSLEQALADSLAQQPGIAFAEVGHGIALQEVVPNDSLFYLQWALRNTGQSGGQPGEDIQATRAWELTTGSSSVRIGIVDEGVYAHHPDLEGKVSGDSWVSAHGTLVAGWIGVRRSLASTLATTIRISAMPS
jgi:subtilisin family serine protease